MKPVARASLRLLKDYWPVLLVLIVGGSLTVVISLWLAKEARVHDRARFETICHSTFELLETRIELFVLGLAGFRDALALEPELNDTAWQKRVDTLKPWVNYRPLFEIGFVEQVDLRPGYRPEMTEEEKHALFNANRARELERRRKLHGKLFTTNLVHATNDWMYYGVRFHVYNEEPTARRKVFRDYGFDMTSERHVYQNLEWALFHNQIGATKPRVLYHDGTTEPVIGVWLFLPVYATDMPASSPPELQAVAARDLKAFGEHGRHRYTAYCRGLVYAGIDMSKFVSRTLKGQKLETDLWLFDSEQRAPEHLLYGDFTRFNSRGERRAALFEATHIRPFYSRRLHAVFRTNEAFEAASHRYRPWLALATGLVLTTAFSGVTFTQVRGRMKDQAISEELRASRDQLKLALQERERLSRDLHDGTIQSIYAVGLGLQHCRKVLASDPAKAPDLLAQSVDELNGIIRELREFILTLEPELLRGQTIDTVLSAYVGRIQKTTDTEIILQVDRGVSEQVEPAQAVHILNLVREGVSNSLKHGHPARIEIKLLQSNGCLQLVMNDNGVGFAVSDHERSGHGLSNMRLRAEHLGGRLDLYSAAGAGTRIVVTLPVFPKDTPDDS